MKIFYGSIRKKLIILVILATMPVFLVLLSTELFNRKTAVKEAERETSLFLNGFAEVQRRITDSTRTLLRTVASIPEIRNGDIERSQAILASLLQANPVYTNIILVDISGNVLTAGNNLDRARQFSFADRKQFIDAISNKGFAPGEFVMGKTSQQAIFPFGMVVLDKDNRPSGALIIGVRLSHYGELFERGAYPADSFVGFCDHNGVRLFRYPLSEKIAIGKPINDKVFKAAVAADGSGSLTAMTTDGLKRVIAFEPIATGDGKPPYMYMFMGFSYKQFQNRAQSILFRAISTSVLSLALTLAIAWFLGGRGIASRIEKLTLQTKKFSQGEENVESDIDYSDGEIGELARSFDNMVHMLRQREQERNSALKQLTASELRFRELIEDVSGISVQGYNEKRQVTFWNYASEQIYGYTAQEAMGKLLEDLIIPEPMIEDVKRLHRLWLEKGEKIPAGELVLIDKKGNDVPVFSSHVMLETQAGKEMFCIDIDLKPLKQAEIEKEKLEKRLRQSQKMEAIGTLAGGIAHDFNNILSPIMGYTELLLEETDEDQLETQDSLNQIYSSALRARDLVLQILTFSRQESTEYASVEIQPIVKEVMKLLRSTIPQSIDIQQFIDPGCRTIFGDATQIHQIIMNLATNAYHAMLDTGGTLTINLHEHSVGDADAEKLNIKAGEYVLLSVTDSGAGISSELVEKIFDPFFTTKEQGKGTGMGLSVVHGIVRQMNGCITVTSTLGQGADFKIYLPIEERKTSTSMNDDFLMPSYLRGSEKILLVDDEQAILNMEMQALERIGYRVTVHNSPFDALATFTATPYEFDLVMTDMSMPGMSGDQLAKKLIQVRPNIPIIICTGYSEKLTPEIVEEIDIKAVLLKPVLLRELYEKLREIFNNN